MVTEQGHPSKKVAAELGICIDTLKSWLKRAGFQPGITDRQNRNDKRQRELEAEIRSLRKQIAEKDEVIDILKKSVGYAFSSRIDTNLTVSAPEMAVNRQKPQTNLIFHSDQGVQYASLGYREALAKHSITQSISGKGDSYDNAVAENFFSCLKCELVHHKHYRTRAEAQADIFSYIEAYYNAVRPQSVLNWLSPLAYEHLMNVYAAKVAWQ